MTGIYLGATKLTSLALGGSTLQAVYLGAQKLWPAGAPATPTVYVTWDAARKASGCTLTGNQVNFSDQGSVAATLSVDAATANRYAEFTISAITGNVIGFGIMRSDYTAFGNVLGVEAAGAASRWSDGSLDWWTGASTSETTGHATFVVGDTIAVCLKRGALYYGKCAGGVTTWLDGCDPVAETGGAVTGIAGRYALAVGAYSSGAARTATLNTGASPWIGQPPAGAVGWALAPTLGAHTMFKGEDTATATPVVVDALNTFNPTSIFVSRAGFASLVVAPTDNKGNAYGDLGSPGVYAGYSGEFDARNYWTGEAVGGAAHVVTLDNSSNPTREVTMEVLEVVRAAGYGVPVTAVAYTYDSGKPTLQGPTIHVGGPSLLVAIWTGDSGQLTHTAVPDAAWSVADSFLTLPPNSAVQYCVAVRDVIDAGDYTVEWAQTPTQGSPLWIFAFENVAPSPRVTLDLTNAPSSLTVGVPVSFTVTAANDDGATGAITISAASLPAGLSISATTGTAPYTATISGTPTTAASAADFVINASNGTQSASATWNVKVNAASSGVTRTAALIHQATTSVASDAFSGVNINAGDLVIVKYSCQWGVNITGVTDSAGKCTFAPATSDPNAVSKSQQMFYAIATGAAAADTINVAFKGGIDTYVMTLEVYSPPSGTAWTYQSALAQFKLDSGQTPSAINSDPLTVAGNGLVALLCGDTRGIATAGFAASPGAIVNSGSSKGGNLAESVEYLFTSGLTSQVLSANVGGDAATPQADWTIKALIVAPFTYA